VEASSGSPVAHINERMIADALSEGVRMDERFALLSPIEIFALSEFVNTSRLMR
jgi:hypothetical protein